VHGVFVASFRFSLRFSRNAGRESRRACAFFSFLRADFESCGGSGGAGWGGSVDWGGDAGWEVGEVAI